MGRAWGGDRRGTGHMSVAHTQRLGPKRSGGATRVHPEFLIASRFAIPEVERSHEERRAQHMSEDVGTVYWGQLKGDENRGLRRGAWYRVVALTPHEAVLDVNRKHVPLDRAAVHLVSALPHAWTVVRRPADAKGVAVEMGEYYAVCPSCRNPAPLHGSPPSARCARCAGLFPAPFRSSFVANA